MGMNHIAIHGRLTKDPELRQTQSGVSVCNFTVAVDRSYTRQGEEKQADFFTVVCWRGLADMVGKWFTKGKEILVTGEMQSRRWEDDEGNKRTAWEIIASSVDFCGNRGDSQPSNQTSDAPAAAGSEFTPIAGNDEDLPF